jgi:hypothetical protein
MENYEEKLTDSLGRIILNVPVILSRYYTHRPSIDA